MDRLGGRGDGHGQLLDLVGHVGRGGHVEHRLEVVAEVELDVVVAGVSGGIDDGVELVGVDVEQGGVVLTGHEHLEAGGVGVVLHRRRPGPPVTSSSSASTSYTPVGAGALRPSTKRESRPRRARPCTGLTVSAVRPAAVRTETPVTMTRPITPTAMRRSAAPHWASRPLEGIGHGGAEVATGGDERRERVAEGRSALGEVEQPGGGDHQEHGTDDHPRGAAGHGAVAVVGAPQQEGAADDERHGDEDPQHAHERAEGIAEATAERSGEVEVDAEAAEQPERDEGDAPDVVAVALEGSSHGAGTGRSRRRRGTALGRGRPLGASRATSGGRAPRALGPP